MKHKVHSAKSKSSQVRYDPNGRRAIQRNLVYISGIPVNLADEEVCPWYITPTFRTSY